MSLPLMNKKCLGCGAAVNLKTSADSFHCEFCGGTTAENSFIAKRAGGEAEDMSVFQLKTSLKINKQQAELTGKASVATKYGHLNIWNVFPPLQEGNCLIETMGSFFIGNIGKQPMSDFDFKKLVPEKKVKIDPVKIFYVESLDKTLEFSVVGELAFSTAGIANRFMAEYTDCKGGYACAIVREDVKEVLFFIGREILYKDLNAENVRVNAEWI